MPRVNKQLRRWFKRNHLCAAAALERQATKMSCHNPRPSALCAPLKQALQIVKVDGLLQPSSPRLPQAQPVLIAVISSRRTVWKCRFGAFLSQSKRNLRLSKKRATGLAAEYRPAASACPLGNRTLTISVAQLANWGVAHPIPDPPVGGEAGTGQGLQGPTGAMIFGFGEY
jgi:hypothetical protein